MLLLFAMVFLILGIIVFIIGAECIYHPKYYLDKTFSHRPSYKEPGPLMQRVTQIIGIACILLSLMVFSFAYFLWV
ncbi:hypothetical protein C455_16163 [Haloferax larsenii JCM 13917]|nr:hypothetical protein C455_16163 [Haloferax larsenii JCM 13917]